MMFLPFDGGNAGADCLSAGCLRLPDGAFGVAEEVGEEAVGSGDAFGKLAVEGEGAVDVGSLAGAGEEEAAFLRVLAGVVDFQEGV